MSGAALEAKALHEDMQWMGTTLGELAEFEMGQAPPGAECNKEGEGTVFVKAGEFGDLFPVEVEWTTKPLKYGRRGDVFICVVGATAGKLNLGIDCAIGRSVAAIRPRDHLDTKFVYYQLMPWVLKLRAESAGSAQGVISKNQLKAISFKVVPLAQQKRIVAEIEKQFSRLDEAVANLKRVKANLKRYKAAVLKAAVEGKLTEEWRAAQGRANVAGGQEPGATKAHPDVEPASTLLDRILAERRAKWEEAELAKMEAKGKAPQNDKWKAKYKEPITPDRAHLPDLPRGWCWTTLDAIADVVDPNPSHRMPYYVESGVPFISSENFYGEEGIDFSIGKQVSVETLKQQRSKFLIEDGDFVLSRIGTIGKTRFLPFGRDYCLSHALVIIKAFTTMTYNEWLRHTISSDRILSQAREGIQSVGVPDLGMGKIRSFNVPLPPTGEQRLIAAEVVRRLSLVVEVEGQVNANLIRAKRLRQSILAKAFSGGLCGRDESFFRMYNVASEA